LPIVSGLNGLVGILGAAGVQLNQNLLPYLINIGVRVLGFIFTYLEGKKK